MSILKNEKLFHFSEVCVVWKKEKLLDGIPLDLIWMSLFVSENSRKANMFFLEGAGSKDLFVEINLEPQLDVSTEIRVAVKVGKTMKLESLGSLEIPKIGRMFLLA